MRKQFLLIFILCSVWSIVSAQNSKVWEYPIQPGSQEWENSNTITEKMGYYNIPVNQLNTMTTEDLVKTCLNYPELRMIFTRNSLQKGYEYLRSQFNGFKELENRTDAGKYLLNIYLEKKHDDVTLIKNLVDKGHFMSSILHVEIMLSQEPIIKNMDKLDMISLKAKAINSFESVERLKEFYSSFPLEMPALIMSRILIIEKETDLTLKSKIDDEIIIFARNSGSPNVSVYYKVYNLARGN
jgi:hypothetical protein